MLALYRSGRQADALDVYTRTREVLDETLGLEPSVTLRSLHERVLRQDANPGRPAGHGPRRSRRRPPLHRQRRPTPAQDFSQPAARRTVTDYGRDPTHRSRAEEDRTAPTNLPTVVRPLIGRDEQLDSIAELLGGVRLLSLIGSRRRRQDIPGARHRRPCVGELP